MTNEKKEIKKLKTDIRAALKSKAGVTPEEKERAGAIMRRYSLITGGDTEPDPWFDDRLQCIEDAEHIMRQYVEQAGEETVFGRLFAEALRQVETADGLIKRYIPLMGEDLELERLFDRFLAKTGPLIYLVKSFDEEFGEKYLTYHIFEQTPEDERASLDDFYFYTAPDGKQSMKFRTKEEKEELSRMRGMPLMVVEAQQKEKNIGIC